MGLKYVIQEHNATRLHWDFRLEHEGVLVSWVLPKPIPTEKNVWRKAILVNDHPMRWGEFEGVIESGYGKGTVKIWDKGTYEPIKFEEEYVVVEIHGEKVKGVYSLRKAKSGKDWFLVRKK